VHDHRSPARPGRRIRPTAGSPAAAIALAVGLATLAAACGSSSGGVTASPATSARPTTVVAMTVATVAATTAPTTAAPTTAASTTAAPTTLPTTTALTTAAPTTWASTTAAPTTTVAAGGWTIGDPPADNPFSPCCESPFSGAPSPTLPTDAATALPDGLYVAVANGPWDPVTPTKLAVTIKRIERCKILGDAGCDQGPDFSDTDMGIAPAPVRTATITLDSSLKVLLGGYHDCDAQFGSGTGADLAELLTAFAADYDELILPQVTAPNADDAAIAKAIEASPSHGFVPNKDQCGGLLEYHDGSAPSLLLQTLTNFQPDTTTTPLSATDLLRPVTLRVQGGTLTLAVYAGFYS
jgi:hypothetical protein